MANQLRSFKDVEPGPLRVLADIELSQFGLEIENVTNLDPRGYFIALLEGMDRTEPELRRNQVEKTRGRKIKDLVIDGDRAEMTTTTTSGDTETFTWVREATGWKCVATSVGEGIK